MQASPSGPRSIGASTPPEDRLGRTPARQSLSIAQLAHELNSLLDGSMRSVALVKESFTQQGARSASTPQWNDAKRSLQAAHEAMQHMARLLSRAMKDPSPGLELFDERQPLSIHVSQAVRAVEPLAQAHGVHIDVELTPRAGALPTATLGPLILNGLRNAIRACASHHSPQRLVELSAFVNQQEQLILSICDTGDGVELREATGEHDSSARHGLGLEICRQIVGDLSGTLRLASVPFGKGAILQACVPIRRLLSDG